MGTDSDPSAVVDASVKVREIEANGTDIIAIGQRRTTCLTRSSCSAESIVHSTFDRKEGYQGLSSSGDPAGCFLPGRSSAGLNSRPSPGQVHDLGNDGGVNFWITVDQHMGFVAFNPRNPSLESLRG